MAIPRTPILMTIINPAAKAAQDQARRQNGEFGEQAHSAPEADAPIRSGNTGTADAWESEPIERDANYPDEPVDLEWINETYRGNSPEVTDAAAHFGDDGSAYVSAMVYENFLWDDRFTEDELDHYQPIVEDVWRERFGADLHVHTDWESVDVTIATPDIPQDELTHGRAADEFHKTWAKYGNETDPGTFNSPYVGNELRERIDEAKRLEDEARDRGVAPFVVAGRDNLPLRNFDTVEDAEAYARGHEGHLGANRVFEGADWRVGYSWRGE